MNDVIHRNDCPVCGSAKLSLIFQAKDHTVSGKRFQISECGNCTLRFTQDAPGEADMSNYYQSNDYISHSNTSQGLVNRLYKAVRRITNRQKRKSVEKNTGLRKGMILDVGSGTGFFLSEMKRNGWQVTGIEPSMQARTVAKKENNVDLEDIGCFHSLQGPYNAITLWHVLEHIHDLNGYLHKFYELLTKDGKLFIAVPNYTCYDSQVYKESWAAYDVPRHLYHFSPKSLLLLMETHGFVVEKIYPMWFDSFYVSFLSSKYKTGKTQWISAIVTASISNFKALLKTDRCSSLIYVIKKKSIA